MPSATRPLALRWTQALAVVAWLPPVILLAMMLPLRVGVPYYDTWGFVEEFRQWQQGHYGWQDLFQMHNMHPSVPGKLIFWAVMQWLRGDTDWLPVMSWLFSIGIAIGVYGLLGSWRKTRPVQAAMLMLAANALIFNAGQGGSWLWDYLYQNYIPGCCMVLGLATLGSSWRMRTRLLLSAGLCLVAALAFGTGFLVGWLMLPSVMLVACRDRPSKTKALTIGWLLFCVALMALVFLGMGRGESHDAHLPMGQRAGSLFGRPLMTLTYGLILLGGNLGHGTSLDPQVQCTLAGGAAVLVFAAALVALWRRRGRPGLWLSAWPWLACCLYSVLNVGSITLARMGMSFVLAFAPRYLVLTHFFILGVMMLVATLLWHESEDAAEATCSTEDGREGWVQVAFTLLLVTLLLNWVDGRSQMLWFSHKLRQARTTLSFTKALPESTKRLLGPVGRIAPELALYLKDQKKLRGIDFLPDAFMSSLRQSTPLVRKGGHFDSLTYDSDGNLVARGVYAGGQSVPETADLILITASSPQVPEHVIALGVPTLPDDYFNDSQLRKQFPEHYSGWKVALDQMPVPGDPGTKVHAYGFDGVSARKIFGEFALPTPGR